MAAVLIPTAHLKNWEKGKAAILKLSQSFLSDATSDTHGLPDAESKESNYTQLLYELISCVVRGQIGHDEVIQLLGEIVPDEERRSILVDVISIMDVDVQFMGKPEQDSFTTFVSALVNTSVVSGDLLKERIDVDTLDSLGLIQSTKGFNSKFVKIKTKLFYKQQKFNLLREESEGYSKLITEFGQEMDSINHTAFLENIKSLIGRFNLDPNRVVDIMLDAFEFNLEEEDFFITLLKEYSSNYDKSTLCNILGFKYQFYKDQPDVEPPHALLYLTALLIKHDLLEINDIYAYLSPSDAEINEDSTQELLDAKQEARKLNAAILTSDTTNNEENKEIEKETKVELKKFNQKFGICHTLLLVGAWSQAKETMDKLPKFAAVSEQPVVEAMCKLIHVLIEPIYRQHSSKAARGRPCSYELSHGPAQCKIFTDLTDCVFPMLFNLGPYLSFDPILMAKVIRVGRAFLKENPNIVTGQDKDAKLLAVWNGLVELVDQVLFPSLSLLECNPSIAEEVWILLKAFPYNIRYCLYGRWKNQSYNLHPKLIDVKAKTIKKAKYIAKRLAKENVKQSGRQIGKLSHSNPGILFEYILSQIQKYDNFIGPVVDSLKYLTPMSYDVLAYCIIEALANPEKERLKLDDTNISEWLKSLAVFCGTVFKKYSIELTGLLQYVANQLKAGKSSDLLVLREVVQKMSGIEISEEVTMDQIEALSGGEMLRAEGGWFGQIRNTKKSSQRLRDTLMDGDLAFPLCILMAQQRNSVIFVDEPSNRHLKLVGKLYDQEPLLDTFCNERPLRAFERNLCGWAMPVCHDTMVQFGGFLASQLNSEDYDNNLPPLEDLVQNFYLSQDAAFFLARPMFANKIQATFDEVLKSEKGKNISQKQIFKLYINAVNSVLEPVTQNVTDLHPLRVWNNISPHLYVAFWSLTMYDLHVPVERYEAEKNKMNDLLNNLDENKELNSASKKKKEKERCLGAIEKLKEEQKEQEQHTQRVKDWLKHEQDSWIPSKSSKNESVTQLLQLCIFPRCVFTASDAIFCAKFVHMLHNLKTPNFSTLLCFDRVFSDISYTVTTLTESEASRYGRFLSSMLEIVMRWHKDKKIYEKECGSYPGFVTVLRTTNTDKAEHLDYENFRHVCHKWQYKLTKALVVCLESKDYTQIRNTIMVLIKILPHYPKVSNLGMALERRVERICEEEKDKRKDLFALAIGYAGKLRTHKSEMIPEAMFHNKAPDTKDKANTNSTNASQSTPNASSQTGAKQEGDEKTVTSQAKSEKQAIQDEKSKTSESTQVNDVEDNMKSTNKQPSSQIIASEKSSSTSLKKSSSSNGMKSSTSLTSKKSLSSVATNDVSVKTKTESSKSMSNSAKSKESKESDREKPNAKESEKSRNHDKPEKSKRSSPNISDSPRDDYDKESKRRKVDKNDSRISSPASSKESTPSTPVDGSSTKNREERSRSNERDKEKEKSHKSDRKRTAESVEIKEVKRRKDEDDSSPLRKSGQFVDEKPKEKEKQEEKVKATIVKLSRKTDEDGVKKEKDKVKEKEKYKDKTKVKDKEKEKEKEKEKDKEKDKDKEKEKEKDKEKDKEKEKEKDKEKKKKSEEKSSSSKKESKSKEKEKEVKDEEKLQKKQHSHSESRRSR